MAVSITILLIFFIHLLYHLLFEYVHWNKVLSLHNSLCMLCQWQFQYIFSMRATILALVWHLMLCSVASENSLSMQNALVLCLEVCVQKPLTNLLNWPLVHIQHFMQPCQTIFLPCFSQGEEFQLAKTSQCEWCCLWHNKCISRRLHAFKIIKLVLIQFWQPCSLGPFSSSIT